MPVASNPALETTEADDGTNTASTVIQATSVTPPAVIQPTR